MTTLRLLHVSMCAVPSLPSFFFEVSSTNWFSTWEAAPDASIASIFPPRLFNSFRHTIWFVMLNYHFEQDRIIFSEMTSFFILCSERLEADLSGLCIVSVTNLCTESNSSCHFQFSSHQSDSGVISIILPGCFFTIFYFLFCLF